MAVEVVIRRKSGVSEHVKDEYEKGRFVFVHDGHLFVTTSPTADLVGTIATYGPGSWVHASVKDD